MLLGMEHAVLTAGSRRSREQRSVSRDAFRRDNQTMTDRQPEGYYSDREVAVPLSSTTICSGRRKAQSPRSPGGQPSKDTREGNLFQLHYDSGSTTAKNLCVDKHLSRFGRNVASTSNKNARIISFCRTKVLTSPRGSEGLHAHRPGF